MKTEEITKMIPEGLKLGRQKIDVEGKKIRVVVKEHYPRDVNGKPFKELHYRVIKYER